MMRAMSLARGIVKNFRNFFFQILLFSCSSRILLTKTVIRAADKKGQKFGTVITTLSGLTLTGRCSHQTCQLFFGHVGPLESEKICYGCHKRENDGTFLQTQVGAINNTDKLI